jgi:hypothetical protein
MIVTPIREQIVNALERDEKDTWILFSQPTISAFEIEGVVFGTYM